MNSKYLDKTDDILKDEMLSRIDRDIRKHSGTFINDSLGPVSIKMAEMYVEMALVVEKMYLENVSGDELDKKISERTKEIKRRKATFARGVLTIEAKPGLSIDRGTIVSNGITQYKTLDSVKIEDKGIGQVKIECLEKGIIGNTDKYTINELTNSIPGIEKIYNKESITGGYDEEDDDTLRARYSEYLKNPATSGNIYHYMQWAKTVPGVGDVKVIPLWNGKNTVKVIIVDDKLQPADEELVERVQNYIDPGITGLGQGTAPIGAYCTVVSARSKKIIVEVELSLDRNYKLNSIKKNIISNIEKYLQEVSFKSSFISYAKLGASILTTDGVLDYRNLQINGDNKNILLDNDEAPVIESVIIDEI